MNARTKFRSHDVTFIGQYGNNSDIIFIKTIWEKIIWSQGELMEEEKYKKKENIDLKNREKDNKQENKERNRENKQENKESDRDNKQDNKNRNRDNKK